MTNTEASASAELPSIADTFSESWRLYVDRLWLVLTVGGLGAAGCLAITVLSVISGVALSLFLSPLLSWALVTLVSMSLLLWGASWSQVAVIEALLDPQKKPGWGECYRLAWPKVAMFCWVGLLFFVLVAGGFFPLIAPGVYLGIALVFAPVAVVAEDAGGWPAMARSLELVSGRWWPVAVRLGLAGLASALPARVPWIGWILGSVSAPFALVSAMTVYAALTRLPPRERAVSALETKVPIALAAFGLLILTALGVKTAMLVRDAMPALTAKYQELMAHPPDPQKLQEILLKLQNGEGPASFTETFHLINSSTGTASAAPAAAP